jgi:chromate transporter
LGVPAARGDGDLGEVARLFLKLGVVGFGGPAAHIALMREEIVKRRQWVDDREFLDLMGATNLIPGPNSTELAMHLGARRGGGRGLVVAGLCFIGPAVAIVSVLAWLYDRYGTDPAVVDMRYGVLPVVIAIVLHALIGLGRTALVRPIAVIVALGAFGAFLANVHELVVLVAGGALSAAWAARGGRAALGALLLPLWQAAGSPDDVSLWRVFLVFLEIGSLLYGSGYVLLAFLQQNFVDELGWLTEQQILDAVAVGQVTPGPLFSTATFVGWQLAGPAGAAVATVGIFLPSFVFVALLARIVDWVRRHSLARAALDGVVAASLGLMAAVLVELAGSALTDLLTVVIAVIAFGLLLGTSIGSAYLIGAGLVIGLVQAAVG